MRNATLRVEVGQEVSSFESVGSLYPSPPSSN